MKKLLFLVVVLTACASGDEIRRDRFFIQGNEALSNNEYDQAIAYYDKALEVDPDFARGYNNRGVARIEDGHPYEAIQDYNMAIRIDSAYFDAIFNRAYAYEEVGKIPQALEDINTVKRAYTDSAYVYFYEGLLYSRVKAYTEAIASFEIARKLDPEDLETQVNLATAFYLKGDLDPAKKLLEAVLEEDPNQPNALNTMSQLHLRQAQYQQALNYINEALNLVPDEPYFLNNRGQIYLEMDQLEVALDDINRSIYLNPDNAWAYRNKGLYFLKKQDYEQAIRLFQGAILRGDFIDEVYAYLGLAYFYTEARSEACSAWEKGKAASEERSMAYLKQHCQ